mmetsp:Transcript_92371/g.155022  ORF Transcript_92371/g.155022 Transcript_92371/m.155022 type:complete len:183 (-) Transcript_92371:644-1192(-)
MHSSFTQLKVQHHRCITYTINHVQDITEWLSNTLLFFSTQLVHQVHSELLGNSPDQGVGQTVQTRVTHCRVCQRSFSVYNEMPRQHDAATYERLPSSAGWAACGTLGHQRGAEEIKKLGNQGSGKKGLGEGAVAEMPTTGQPLCTHTMVRPASWDYPGSEISTDSTEIQPRSVNVLWWGHIF